MKPLFRSLAHYLAAVAALALIPVASIAQTSITTTNTATKSAGVVTFNAGTAVIDAGALTSGTIPAARLPNPSASTLGGVQSKAAVSNQWINAISTSGVPGLTQPAFSNLSGSAACSQLPALTGDITSSAGSCATTLAGVISAGGPTGSATVAPIITYDAKGRLTAVSSATITPAVASITGLGTGVAAAAANTLNASGGLVGYSGSGGVFGATTLSVASASLNGNNFAVSGGSGLYGDVTIAGSGNLIFGTTTSSFPMLKRSSTSVAFRLADDSAAAPISAAAVSATSVAVNGCTIGGTDKLCVFGTTTFGNNIVFSPDASWDIGASGATRPRAVYASGNVQAGGAHSWPNGSSFQSPSNGIITAYDSSNADFLRLQLGGTTSSYPAIKRDFQAIRFRLADDSADAGISAASVETPRLSSLSSNGHVSVGGSNGTLSVSATIPATDLSGTIAAARLPNPTASTLGGVESIAAVSHQWVNTISTSGVPGLTQPAFSDISGSAACSQMPALTGAVTSSAGSCATTLAPIAKAPTSLTDNGTTIATDASLNNAFRITALTANVTLSNPTNSADGQIVTWEVIQNASAAKTLAFGANFGFGAEITGCTISTGLSSHSFVTAIYNSTSTKWYVRGCITGY